MPKNDYSQLSRKQWDELEGICRQYLAEYMKDYHGITDPKKQFSCIFGTHTDKKPSAGFVKDGDKIIPRIHCFSCDHSADIFELVETEQHISDFREQIIWIYEKYGHELPSLKEQETKPVKSDFTQEEKNIYAVNKWHKDLEKAKEYLCKERCLSPAVVESHHCGFVKDFHHKEEEIWTKAVSIPTGAFPYKHYTIRTLDPKATAKYHRSKGTTGGDKFLNIENLFKDRPVFVVEGEIDCLSAESAGFNACSIGSTSNINDLITFIKENPKCKSKLILCFDNDTEKEFNAGQEAQESLIELLKKEKIPFFKPAPMPDGINDFNDYLCKDKEGFKIYLQRQENCAQGKVEPPFKFYNVDKQFPSFLTGFALNKGELKKETGFKYLDLCLKGGFKLGSLVELTAMSGFNKTALFLQLACHYAQQGIDVLYVSLENSGEELIARALSMLMHKTVDEDEVLKRKFQDFTLSKLTCEYSDIQADCEKTPEQKIVYDLAVQDFQKIAQHLYFAEGTGSITADDVAALCESHIKIHKQMPIVFVDYLQILKPSDSKATDKQATDYNILEMKQIATGNLLERKVFKPARDLRTIIFVIIAQNRSSYAQTATESSGRDSSCLEYSCDYLLSIEPSLLKTLKPSQSAQELKAQGQAIVDTEKGKPIRDFDLKIIKMRDRNPPKKDKMPAFKCFHGVYFKPAFAGATVEQEPAEDKDFDIFNPSEKW